jgi:uncharacterized membrane protein YesL
LPLLSVESRFVHFLEFLFELIVLNLLTLLCCLPLLTVGAAITALYRSLFDMRQGKGNIVKGYFKAFVDNIRPGLLLGVIFIVMCISFVLYVIFFQDLIAAGDVLVLGGIVFVGVIFFFPMTFAFPLLAMFDSPALRTMSNAFLLSFRHAGTTLAVLLLYGLPWVLLAISLSWFLRILPLLLLFGFSFPGWVASYLFLNVFKKYVELDFPLREVR